MNASTTRPDKVPFINKLAFGSGDVGPAIVTGIKQFFLNYFLLDIARLDPGLIGPMLLIATLWDAVNDPIFGVLSDRTRTRWGRRRPWFLFGAIPFGVCFYLLFQVPALDTMGKFWYYLVILLLLDTGFTAVNMPYTALAAEMTPDYNERTSLTSFRFVFSIGSSIVAVLIHTTIVGMLAPQGGAALASAYAMSAAVLAVVVVLPFFFAFWGTYERYQAEDDKADALPFLQGLRVAFANKAFICVVLIYLLSWLVIQSVSTIIVLYIRYWLRRPDELTQPVLLTVQVSALLWLVFWSWVSKRTGKQGVYYYGMTLWIVVSMGMFFVQPDWPAWVVLALSFLAGGGIATAYLVPWSMLPDVVEEDEWETGQRREGVFFSFFALLQKGGLALGLMLINQSLALAGYITPPENFAGIVVQPDAVLLVIRAFVGPIPAVILALSMIVVRLYPITRERHEATVKKLAIRRGKAAVG